MSNFPSPLLKTAFFLMSWLTLSILSVQKLHAFPVVEKPWNAFWITHESASGSEYGVYYFKKVMELTMKPKSFVVKVSGDNRYKLYINGRLISVGPARADLFFWNYETIDLAPYLKAGKNSVAAVVWNDGKFRPEAQISFRTGFILQGNTEAEEVVNTGKDWKCFQDKGYSPLTGIGHGGYYVADAGEMVDMNQSVKNWMNIEFDDSKWPAAQQLDIGKLKGFPDASGWMLVGSPLPQMERTLTRIPVLRKATGVNVPKTFPLKKTEIIVPPNTNATLLLDQTQLTNAYITLNFSKGEGAGISLTYAESPFDDLKKYGTRKGNRNDIEGKDFAGRKDSIISDGTSGQSFNTKYWRTFRYLLIKVSTKDAPLILDDIFGTYTGYPFELAAKAEVDRPDVQQILNIGWHTARMNAIETYMDCPYYEQLQYIGDTRIQAMVTYYNSTDDRLPKNAIMEMNHSRIAEGLTSSRHPSFTPQFIPTFSLWYIGVLHDYWMYRPDSTFVKDKLEGMRSILRFFNKYQQSTGSLKDVPYWNFIDWPQDKNWVRGTAPKGIEGGSAVLDLQLLMAYQTASEMESKIGMKAYATAYQSEAAKLKQAILTRYWDQSKGLFADNEDKILFSQHTNSLAILAGVVAPKDQLLISKKMLTDTTLTQCTIYFKYYLHQALIKSGLGNDYLNWLGVWRDHISAGLTTWAEISDFTRARSDCHAWGSSPNIEFYRTILGIDSDAPGFKKVKIEPHLTGIERGNISGEIPHPEGKIAVAYLRMPDGWKVLITLPGNTSGVFIWKGVSHPLSPGANTFRFSS